MSPGAKAQGKAMGGTAEGGYQTPRAGRYVAGIGDRSIATMRRATRAA